MRNRVGICVYEHVGLTKAQRDTMTRTHFSPEDESFDYLANWDETKLRSYLCLKKRFVNPPHLTQESMDKTIKRVHCFKDTH